MHIPVYVINLDRRPDRWLKMRGQLKDIGLAYERIAAFDWRNAAMPVYSKQHHLRFFGNVQKTVEGGG